MFWSCFLLFVDRKNFVSLTFYHPPLVVCKCENTAPKVNTSNAHSCGIEQHKIVNLNQEMSKDTYMYECAYLVRGAH